MSYIYISIATLLLSIQFVFTKKYQKSVGDNNFSALIYCTISPIAFAVILFFMDGMKFEITWFSAVSAFLSALLCNICTFLTIKAFSLGSLTNYSLWLMSGGMILPVLYGVVFENDTVGVFKSIGILLVLAAIITKMDFKEKSSKKAVCCFLFLFFFNGLLGVVSSIYQSSIFTFEKVSSTPFSIQVNIFRALTGGIMLGIMLLRNSSKNQERKQGKDYLKASFWAEIGGICNGAANLFLLLALLALEPSLQYPMLTGGCIFLSAIFGLFFKEKLSKREWLAVGIAVIGTIIMAF